MRKFFGRLLIGGLALLAVAGAGWLFMKSKDARNHANPAWARKQDKPLPVRTELVTEKEIEHVIGGTAVTVPQEVAVIRVGAINRRPNDPAADLILKSKYVENGTQVKRGQVLFELEDDLFRLIVKERQLTMDAARAELERVQEKLLLNQKVRELALTSAEEGMAFRKQEQEIRKDALGIADTLHKKGALGLLDWYEARSKYSQARYDQAEAERQLQRARLMLAVGPLADKEELAGVQARHDTARIELEAAQIKVQRCQIKSPIHGFISQVTVVPGQILEDNAVVAEVVKLDPIHVRMDFPQENIGEVALGQKAEVVLDSSPRETFHGTVVRIIPQVKPEQRVLPVLIELQNPRQHINPGVSGFVRLRQTRKTLAVPAQAVLQNGTKSMVFRVEDGKARIREIKTGSLVQTGLLEVRHGLAPGEEIVVFHNFYLTTGTLTKTNSFLQDNDPIDPNWRVWARRE